MQYHSVYTMPMKLNPFRIPELRDLPGTVSRQEVLASAKGRKPFNFSLPYIIMFLAGLLLLIPVVLWFVIGEGGWPLIPVSYTHLTLPTICSV